MQVKINGILLAVDPEFSNRDLTGQDLSMHNLDNRVIYNSCFSNEKPHAEVLPMDVKNLILAECNLDNVAIPEGAILFDCSNRIFEVQSDSFDWLIDPISLAPVAPLDLKFFEKYALSPDPEDLP